MIAARSYERAFPKEALLREGLGMRLTFIANYRVIAAYAG